MVSLADTFAGALAAFGLVALALAGCALCAWAVAWLDGRAMRRAARGRLTEHPEARPDRRR